MTDTDLEIIVFVLLAVAIGVYVCVSSSIKRKKAAENAIKKAWGKRLYTREQMRVLNIYRIMPKVIRVNL